MRIYATPGESLERVASVDIKKETLEGPTVLRFGTSNHHLARSKDQCGSLGLTNTHDDSGETLWIVFRVSCVKRNGLQIETAIEVDRSNDVSSNMPLSLKINKRHNKMYTHCKVGTRTESVSYSYMRQIRRREFYLIHLHLAQHQGSQQELWESPRCRGTRHPLLLIAADRFGMHRSRRSPGSYHLFQRVASVLLLRLERTRRQAR